MGLLAHKKEGNKYWIYGEDAALAARFTKYLTKVLYARRASYIRTKMAEAAHEGLRTRDRLQCFGDEKITEIAALLFVFEWLR